MSTVLPFPPPASPTRQVVGAALEELLHMGLRVAAASTRLAEVELDAADLLAKEAAKAVGAVRVQESLPAAIEVGHLHDVAEAARDMAATRMALITSTFERASRAVRRTAALMLRAEEQRAFRQAPQPSGRMPEEASARGQDEAHEDFGERADPPEIDDEIGDRATHEVLTDIRRDLRQAALVENVRPAETPAPAAAPRPQRRPRPANDPRQAWPGIFQDPPQPDD